MCKTFYLFYRPTELEHGISVLEESERMDSDVKETEIDVKAVIKESVLLLCKG